MLGPALRLSQRRAEWLGAELAAAVGREGVAAMVGDAIAIAGDGTPVRLSEYARQLGELEARERATAARLAETMARLGIEHTAANRGDGLMPVTRPVEWIVAVVEALGHDWSDPLVRSTAQDALRASARARGVQV